MSSTLTCCQVSYLCGFFQRFDFSCLVQIKVVLFIFRRIMHKKQSSLSQSRSATRFQHCPQKITFQTILKRRNDTIAASQLYEASHSSKSSRISSRSTLIEKKQPARKEEPKQLDIREYVKTMGIKKVDLDPKPVPHVALQEQQLIPQKTSRSNRSCYSATAPELKKVESKGKKTIEELENKIESLISNSIQVLKKQKSNIGLSKWTQVRRSSSLDQDFKQITQYFDQLKVQLEEDETYNEKIADLNKKIELLEKMMASQNAESEIIKHQYYNWKNQRGNTSSFSSKKMLAESYRFNKETRAVFNTRKQTCSQTKKQSDSVTHFNSTSKLFFTKPSKQHYLGPKPKNNSYCLNRQPMPRSSYSAQYLNYGYIPTYTYKPDGIPSLPEASLAIKASTYQQEYKQKLGLTNNISIKDLDCTRDKFKNPNMSFMSCSRKSLNQESKGQKRYINAQSAKQNVKASMTRHDSSLIGCMSLTASSTNFFKSEHNKEYVWHNYIEKEEERKQEILKSEIKDKRLQNMKDKFKAIAMRN